MAAQEHGLCALGPDPRQMGLAAGRRPDQQAGGAGQAGQRSTASSASRLDGAGRKSASPSPTACGRSSTSWRGAAPPHGAAEGHRRQRRQRATRAASRSPGGMDVGNGRGDHNDAGHDQQWPHQDSRPGRIDSCASTAPPSDDLQEGGQPCRPAAARPGTGRRSSAGQGAGHDQQIAPDHQYRHPSRQMAVERQGEEQAVHQQLVGDRVEHGAQRRDAVEALGDIPVGRGRSAPQEEQQRSTMIGSARTSKTIGTTQNKRARVSRLAALPAPAHSRRSGDTARRRTSPGRPLVATAIHLLSSANDRPTRSDARASAPVRRDSR